MKGCYENTGSAILICPCHAEAPRCHCYENEGSAFILEGARDYGHKRFRSKQKPLAFLLVSGFSLRRESVPRNEELPISCWCIS